MNPQEPEEISLSIVESQSFTSTTTSSSSSSSSASCSGSRSSSPKLHTTSTTKHHHHKQYSPISSSTCSVSSSYSNSSQNHHQQPSQSQQYKRRKPNRILLYVRNRSTTKQATNITAMIIAIILCSLIVHRLCSIIMTHRRWINAPITYMHRTCPTPQYELLFPKPHEDDHDVILPYQNLMEEENHHMTSIHQDQRSVIASSSTAPAIKTTKSSTTKVEQVLDEEVVTTPLKICITSLTDQKSPSRLQRLMRWRNFDGILELTKSNKDAYCQKHSYHIYDGSDQYDPSRPPAWSKIRAIQYLLSEPESCDWVLWMDADTVIMNSDVRIEDFLPKDPTKDLVVASDKGGGYNSGVLLFRNSKWSNNFLNDWWNMKDFVRPHGLSLSGDNAALKSLLKSMEDTHTFDDHVVVPPRCTMNSFAQFLTLGQSIEIMDHLTEQEWYMDHEHYHKGDFIAHIPGVDNKAECLKLLLREAR